MNILKTMFAHEMLGVACVVWGGLAVLAERVPAGLTDLTVADESKVTSSQGTFHYDAAQKDNNKAFCAFNDNIEDRVLAVGGAFDVIYTFDEATLVNGYSIRSVSSAFSHYGSGHGRDIKTWTFEGSNDDENWTVLDARDEGRAWTDSEQRYFITGNTTAYRKYRLYVTSNFNDFQKETSGTIYANFAEMELYYDPNPDSRPTLTTQMCAKKLPMSCDEVEAGIELTEFPVLVRLSESLNGFHFNDVYEDDHADIMFVDEAGNELPYEIEAWDPNGTALIWVRLAKLKKNATFTMYYGAVDARAVNDSREVWSKYTAVWHFAEANSWDSKTGTLAAVLENGDNGCDSLVGRGFAHTRALCDIPEDRKLGVGTAITISGWVYPMANTSTARIISTKGIYTASGLELMSVNEKGLYLRGDGGSNQATWKGASVDETFPKEAWHHYAGLWNGKTGTIYFDGDVKATTSSLTPISAHHSDKMGFGGCGRGASDPNLVTGMMDELRIFTGEAGETWLKQEYLSIIDPTYVTYQPVEQNSTEAPVFSEVRLTRSETGVYGVSITLDSGAAEAEYYALATASDGTVVRADIMFTGSDYPKAGTATFEGLSADKTWSYVVRGVVSESVRTIVRGAEVFYSGTLGITKIGDANEDGLVSGAITISRADAGEALSVPYTVGGTATAGKVYEALSGQAMIPYGATRVTISVNPLHCGTVAEDTSVVVSFDAGFYALPDLSTITINVQNLPYPDNCNVWIATERDKASKDSNWSLGRAPNAADHVLFDGRFSEKFCDWDMAATHEVENWTMAESYSNGIIIVHTTYPDYNGNFTCLTVSGDMMVEGGDVRQETHGTETARMYRLRLAVGHDMRIAAGAQVGAYNRGRRSDYATWRMAAPHGGEMNRPNANDEVVSGFDSLFEPIENGWGSCEGTGSGRSVNGGGAVYITVGGAFTNNGKVTATSGYMEAAGGAGGAIFVRAATIAGAGAYEANGAKGSKTDGCNASGAGGRIALVASDENAADISKISCYGCHEKWNAAGGAGTVYLKGANIETVLVRNSHQEANTVETIIPSPNDVYDSRRWKNVAVQVAACAHLKIGRDMRVASLSVVNGTTDDVDLNGKTIYVRRVEVEGIDLKLMPGDYKWTDAERNGWTWLKDSSEDKTGILRIFGDAFRITIR